MLRKWVRFNGPPTTPPRADLRDSIGYDMRVFGMHLKKETRPVQFIKTVRHHCSRAASSGIVENGIILMALSSAT